MSNPMPSLILSTTGTSLLMHKVSQVMRDFLNSVSNLKEAELDPASKQGIVQHFQKVRSDFLASPLDVQCSGSAEMKALAAYYKKHLPTGAQDLHMLLHTDTYVGTLAASVIAEALRVHGITNVQLLPMPKMNTANSEDFHFASLGILKAVLGDSDADFNLQSYKRAGYRIVFNLTGGFKSVSGFLQAIGMAYADDIFYIFETADHLVHIPILPFSLESQLLHSLEPHLPKLRRILLQDDFLPLKEFDDLPKHLYEPDGQQASFSALGFVLVKKLQDDLYSKSLLASPHPKIKFSQKFLDSCKGLESRQFQMLNEKIDNFVIYLLKGQILKRFNLKDISSGSPVPGSTHEFYAWSDGNAGRVFLHKDSQGNWILDQLDKHL